MRAAMSSKLRSTISMPEMTATTSVAPREASTARSRLSTMGRKSRRLSSRPRRSASSASRRARFRKLSKSAMVRSSWSFSLSRSVVRS
jgi:hypothetical protein